MTRINCIDPALLSDKHLGAEYRELPRVFSLVKAAADRGEKPCDRRNPVSYTLGTGHVRFFYGRLQYLVGRHASLVAECRKRGRAVNHPSVDELLHGIPAEWFGNWKPSKADEDLNISRINQRGGLR